LWDGHQVINRLKGIYIRSMIYPLLRLLVIIDEQKPSETMFLTVEHLEAEDLPSGNQTWLAETSTITSMIFRYFQAFAVFSHIFQ
jgi:hypothetical protein